VFGGHVPRLAEAADRGERRDRDLVDVCDVIWIADLAEDVKTPLRPAQSGRKVALREGGYGARGPGERTRLNVA
jgi:hypothetical protein